MSLESELKAIWEVKDNILVGHYIKTPKGYFIEDVRKKNFAFIYYQDDSTKSSITIPLRGAIDGLKEDDYYLFSWKLQKKIKGSKYNITVDLTKPITPVDPESFIKLLYKDLYGDESKIVNMLTDSLDMISKQLTASSEGTFIYELLQNANDYPVKVGEVVEPVDVEFYITKNYLIYRHTGAYFSPRNISGICSINEKDKSKNKNAIGYKGIGFKTVFLDNNYVYLRTGDYSFRFDEKAIIAQNKPWQIIPIWTLPSSVPAEVNNIMHIKPDDFRVQIALRPKDKKILRDIDLNYEYLFADMFKDKRVIIFIPNIRTVKIVLSSKTITCTKQSDSWVVTDHPYNQILSQSDQDDINKEIEGGRNRIPEKYKDFGDTNISFACKRDGRRILPVSKANVYCYLPTLASFNFPFLMNTDMIPTGPRDDIEIKIKFNHKLAYYAGKKFVEWLRDLADSGEYDYASIFTLIPDFDECRERQEKYTDLINQFEKGFEESIYETAFIPTKQDGEIVLESIANVIEDTTWLTADKVMDDETFYDLWDTSSWLPVEELRSCDAFRNLLNKYGDTANLFDEDELKGIFHKEDFKAWLQLQENNNKWIKFLLIRELYNSFLDEEMFLCEGDDEYLYKSEELYYDIDEEIKDLSCFEDLFARLRVATRKYLKKEKVNKDLESSFSFIVYDAKDIVDNIILSDGNKNDSIELLKVKNNSIGFFHFLAISNLGDEKYRELPYFNNKKVVVDSMENLVFYPTDDPQAILKKSWLDPLWVNFISKDYLKRDEDAMRDFFDSLDVRTYSDDEIIDSIILEDSYASDINEKIKKNFKINADFVKFLYIHKNLIEDGALSNYILFCKDKNNKSLALSSSDRLYFKNKVFDKYVSKAWLSENAMHFFDDSYYTAILGDGSTKLRELKRFFSTKFGIGELTEDSFYKEVFKSDLDNIKEKCEEKEFNLEVYSFLAEKYDLIFNREKDDDIYKSFPFINHDGNMIITWDSVEAFYRYSKDAVSILDENWLPKDIIVVASKEYADRIPQKSYEKLMSSLFFEKFKYTSFFTDIIVEKKSKILPIIKKEYSENYAFHSFIIRHLNKFAADDVKKLKDYPVFLVSGYNEKGKKYWITLSEKSTGHYLGDNALLNFISDGIVTGQEFDAIFSDYSLKNPNNETYWIDLLGNKRLDDQKYASVFTDVSFKKIQGKICDNEEMNLKFWRDVEECISSPSLLPSFRKFPIISIAKNSRTHIYKEDIYVYGDNAAIYIADDYFPEGKGIISAVKKFNPEAYIVSSKYLPNKEENTRAKWMKFWKRVGLLSNNQEILFRSVIPNLALLKDETPISLLLSNLQAVNEKWDSVKEQLCVLNVRTRGGSYICIKDVIIISSTKPEPFPYITLDDELDTNYDNKARGFFSRIIEELDKETITTVTQWQELKIKQYLKLQNSENGVTLDFHMKFIRDLSSIYKINKNELNNNTDICEIQLLNREEVYQDSNTLTLGSEYFPYCDFEANGVGDKLTYLSTVYSKEETWKDIRKFITDKLDVHCAFTENDIPLLEIRDFAIYYWTEYLSKKEHRINDAYSWIASGKFRGIKCVPNQNGEMCAANHMYSRTLIGELVRYIPNGKQYLPDKFIPKTIGENALDNPIDSLDFKKELTIEHCFDYLLNSNPKWTDRRKEVLSRIVAIKNELDDDLLDDYLSQPNAKWLTGSGEVAPVKELFAIGSDEMNARIITYFGNDSNIASSSNFPEDEYDGVCEIFFKNRVLNDSDFAIIHPQDESDIKEKTSDILPFMEGRALLLSVFVHGKDEDWQDSYHSLLSKVNNMRFFKCHWISYQCNVVPEISKKNIFDFYIEGSSFYFIRKWQSKQHYQDFVDSCINYLDIQNGDYQIIKQLLDDELAGEDLKEFVEDYCVDYLEDSEFQNKLIYYFGDLWKDSDFNSDSKEDDDYEPDEDGYSFKSHKHNENEADAMTEDEEDDFEDEDNEDSEEGDFEDEDEKGNNDKSSNKDSRRSHNTHRNTQNGKSNTASDHRQNPERQQPSDNKKTMEDKLKEKWQQQKNADIGAPHTSKRTTYEDSSMVKSSSDTLPKESGFKAGAGKGVKHYKKPHNIDVPRTDKSDDIERNAQKEARTAKDNFDLATLFTNSDKYTFLWFKYLAELMFADQVEEYDGNVRIEFSFIEEKIPTVFSLKQPSRYLPKWLETPNTKIIRVRGDNGFSFIPEILFVKEDEVAIIADCLNASQLAILKSAKSVILEATGVSTNHVKALYSRFLRLPLSDNDNLKEELPGNIKYIYGPAGTGKTSEVARQIIDKLKPKDCIVNILALAPTNKAADVIAERLLEVDYDGFYKNNIYRFGTTESQKLLFEGNATPTSSPFISYEHHHVVVTTTARFAYNYLQRENEDPIAICDYDWDYIFIDEASMIDIVTIAYIIYKAKPKGFIIAGDPMQIRPVKQNEIDPINIYDMVEINSFAEAQTRDDVQTLMVQHRSISTLGNLVSNLAYDGLLQSERVDGKAKPLKIGLRNIFPVNFLGYRTVKFDMIYGFDAINDSSFHLHSAIFSYRFAEYMANEIHKCYPECIYDKEQLGWTKEKERYSIGIISPYGAQARCVQNMLEYRSIDNPQCKVLSGTVHRFQGGECDIVLVLLNTPEYAGENAHVNNLNLINVALSRARDYLFIITPEDDIPGFTMKADIFNLVPDKSKSILLCSQIEKQLWKDPDFIYNNTNVALHSSVNVYYKPNRIYEVRKDDTAVDIQINDQVDPYFNSKQEKME